MDERTMRRMLDSTQSLKRQALKRSIGVIGAGGTISIGGSPHENVNKLSSYVPAEGDTVYVARSGNDLTILGAVGEYDAPSQADAGSGWTNVQNLGAEGDGTTDDTAALQAAIDEAAGGGIVYIPAGTYIISELDILDGVMMIGDGKAKTIIKAQSGTTGTSTGSLIRFRYSVGDSEPNNESHMYGAGMRDLTIDGNGRSPAVHAVELRFVDRFRFDAVLIRHFNGAGIFVSRGVRESAFDDVYVRHCGNGTYAAVHIVDDDSTAATDASNEVFFYGLRVVFSQGHALRIEKDVTYTNPSRLLYFIGCMFHGATSPVEADEDGYSYTVSTNDYSGHCVLIRDSRYVHFVGCSFHRSGRGQALVRTAQGNNGASSSNVVNLTDCYFGQTNYSAAAFTADTGTDIITETAATLYLSTGAVVRVGTFGTLPAPLVAATDYWVIRVTDSTFRLATSRANALANTYIDITTAGTVAQTVAPRDIAVEVEWGQVKLAQYSAATAQDSNSRFVNRTGTASDLQAVSYANL